MKISTLSGTQMKDALCHRYGEFSEMKPTPPLIACCIDPDYHNIAKSACAPKPKEDKHFASSSTWPKPISVTAHTTCDHVSFNTEGAPPGIDSYTDALTFMDRGSNFRMAQPTKSKGDAETLSTLKFMKGADI